MNRNVFAMKNSTHNNNQANDALKARLLERIHRLKYDDKNEIAEMEDWQKEEADILIAKWRAIS